MAAPDLSIVTASIDFSSVIVAIVSVFSALIAVYTFVKGVFITVNAVGRPQGDPVDKSAVLSSKRWEALVSQEDGIWFRNVKTDEVKFRRRRR